MAGSRSGATSVRRLLNAARFSLEGFRSALSESAFRLELSLAAVLIPLGLYLGMSGVERALLVGSVLLVLIVELANSAIEAVVDRISLEEHPLAKRAKDLGSAAVMIALCNVAAVWLLILL
jgi:diacylglycerol kinase (ATP)